MGRQIVQITESLNTFREKFNITSKDVGDKELLGTDIDSDIVGALNELETFARGANADYNLTTTAQNVRDALIEHDSDIGNREDLNTDFFKNHPVHSSSLPAGIDSLGQASLVAAINELDYRLDSIDPLLDQAVLTTSNVVFSKVNVGTYQAANNLLLHDSAIKRPGGSLTVDVAGDITLDAQGKTINLKNGPGGDTWAFELNSDTSATFTSPGNFKYDVGGNITLDAHNQVINFASRDSNHMVLTLKSNNNEFAVDNNLVFDVVNNIVVDAGGGTVSFRNDSVDVAAFSLDSAQGMVFDVVGSLRLDAGTGQVTLRRNGTMYGGLYDSGGNLAILNNNSLALRFDSSNGTTLKGALYLDSSLGTNSIKNANSTVAGAITNLDSALGTRGNLATTTKVSVVDAVNELNTRMPDIYDASGTLLNGAV